MIAGRLPFDGSLPWFASTFVIGAALALIGRRWGRGVLLLAVPLSVLTAHSLQQKFLPLSVDAPDFRRANPVAQPVEVFRSIREQLLPLRPVLLEGADQRLAGLELELAQGLSIAVVAASLPGASSLTTDDRGALYVSAPEFGLIYRLLDENGDGLFEQRSVFCRDLEQPMGIGWHDGTLLVATRTALLCLRDDDGNGVVDGREVVASDLPAASAGELRSVLAAEDGVYVSIAGRHGEGVGNDWREASILKIYPQGKTELFAGGIHQCRGLARHPLSGSLWGSDDSPESLDFSSRPDEINVLFAHQDYGWPFCYGNRKPDQKLGTVEICQATRPALLTLLPHAVPGALVFGYPLMGAEVYRHMLYVVLEGRGDDPQRQGFRLVGMPLAADGRALGWSVDLVRGWASPEGEKIDGMPTGVTALGHALYVSDRQNGAIYRIVIPPAVQ